MIIGLTGTNASGKGTVAEYLAGKGFARYSLSDELRNIMRQEGIPLTRQNMIQAGIKCRSEHGNGCLAKRVSGKLKGKNAVVDSIRHPEEAKELKKLDGFMLMAVDAPAELRYERSRARGSERDEKSLHDFIERESGEMHGKGAEQQIAAVMQMADCKITNDGSLEKLYKKVDATLEKAK